MNQLLESIRRHWAAVMVIGVMRIVLALVFIPTGLRKLLGIPFSRNLEPWAAFFFDALYAAGPYWRFLGLCEVTAGLLLLVPRFTLLGALMYASIATNLLVITVSLRFLPDAIISTALMLLASLALIAWDWSKVKVLFSVNPDDSSVRRTFRGSLVEAWHHRGFRIALAGIVSLWLVVHFLDRMESSVLRLAVPVLAGSLAVLIIAAFAMAVRDARLRSAETMSSETGGQDEGANLESNDPALR